MYVEPFVRLKSVIYLSVVSENHSCDKMKAGFIAGPSLSALIQHHIKQLSGACGRNL